MDQLSHSGTDDGLAVFPVCLKAITEGADDGIVLLGDHGGHVQCLA